MEKDNNGANSRSHNNNAIIRCARAALLLSSLKTNLLTQEKEMMKQTVDDLKMEIIEMKLKKKKLKLCDFLEFVIQIILLFSLLTFFVLLAFKLC